MLWLVPNLFNNDEPVSQSDNDCTIEMARRMCGSAGLMTFEYRIAVDNSPQGTEGSATGIVIGAQNDTTSESCEVECNPP